MEDMKMEMPVLSIRNFSKTYREENGQWWI